MDTALRPRDGTPLTIGGIKWHVLFTWAVIDQLQEEFDLPISEVMNRLMDPRTMFSAAGHIITALLDDVLYRTNGSEMTAPTFDQVMHVCDISQTNDIVAALLKAYGVNMPEIDDEFVDNDEEPEKLNIARLLIIGKTELGMTEEEFWKTTPRKYFKLFDEYQQLKGTKKKVKKSGGGTIDDLP